jgi:HEAT repeat protein
MTLNRLLIILVVLMALAGGGIAWLWQYAYTPQGRARNVLTELRHDTTSPCGWMIKHGLIKREITTDKEEVDPPNEWNILALDFEERAAKKWAQIGPEAWPVVLEAMDDPNGLVQTAAAKACAQMGNPQAVRALLDKAFPEGHFDRSEIGQALNECRSPQALPAFIEGLRSSNRDVQVYCAIALGQIGDPQAVEPLIAAMRDLENKGHPGVSPSSFKGDLEEVALSLDRCADSSSVPALIRALDDKEHSIHMAALTSLARLKDRRATMPLSALLASGSDNEIGMALTALHETDDARTVQGLLVVLERGNIENRIPAAGILVCLGHKEGLNFLVGLLKTNDPDNRAYVRRVLTDSAIRHSSSLGFVVDSMLPLAKDPHWEVRQAFARMMVDLRPIRAVGVLRKMQKDPQEEVRRAAADALEMIEVDHPGSTTQMAPVEK